MTKRGLAVGPANYAGQAYRWSEAVKSHLQIPAAAFATSGTIFPSRGSGVHHFPVHHRLPHHRLSTSWGKKRRMQRILRNTTHLAIDGFLPIYGRMDRSSIEGDLEELMRRGLRVALIAHGSDLRDPDAHMSRHKFSFYASASPEWVQTLRRTSQHNRSVAASLGIPLFVSTPDLLLDAPHARWLPLCIDPGPWSARHPALQSAKPTVLHIPSRREPPIKGTEVIDPILRRLALRGRIKYLAPASVTHDEMPRLVQQSDIVVDQILTGSYGVAAVEGMAAARLVIGFVGDQTRAHIVGVPPIIDAPPDQFEAVMDEVLQNRNSFAAAAASGPTYVETWHNGGASAVALDTFLS